jgi:hypothetical protein
MGMGPTEIFSQSIFLRPDSLETAGKPARMGQNGSLSASANTVSARGVCLWWRPRCPIPSPHVSTIDARKSDHGVPCDIGCISACHLAQVSGHDRCPAVRCAALRRLLAEPPGIGHGPGAACVRN